MASAHSVCHTVLRSMVALPAGAGLPSGSASDARVGLNLLEGSPFMDRRGSHPHAHSAGHGIPALMH